MEVILASVEVGSCKRNQLVMTLAQLHRLDEHELAMVLFIVNHLTPVLPYEIPPQGLTWFKKGMLEKKIGEAFPALKHEAHSIFSSLLNKLGVQHEIKYEQPPLPVSCSIAESA